MMIREAVAQLELLDPDSTICARRPWEPTSECIVTRSDEDGRLPASIKEAGFTTLLSVNECLEVLGAFKGRPPTLDEKVRLLIEYAVTDAYPDWVFERGE